jgi:hypothetical protein
MQTETIYMYLPDEAVDVWRPVQVEKLGADRYRILGPVPEDEVWQFPPGSIVGVHLKRIEGGDFPVAAYNAAH